MKKLLTLLIFTVSFAVQAQKITEKDLQGSWQLAGLNDGDVILDFEKGTAKLTKESAEGLTRQEIREEEAEVKEEMEDYKMDFPSTLTIKGNQVRAELDGESGVSTFAIENGDTLVVTSSGAETESYKIELSGNKLTLNEPSEGVSLIYKKL